MREFMHLGDFLTRTWFEMDILKVLRLKAECGAELTAPPPPLKVLSPRKEFRHPSRSRTRPYASGSDFFIAQ